MQSLLYGLFSESPWNSESVQIPYKIINGSFWAKLTCFPYNNIYIICYHCTDKNRTRRIQFTQDQQNRTIEDCKNVAWSDESWFLLQHSDVGSEFGVKNMKAWIILPCLNGSGCWWWCNGVGDIFLAHFGSLSTNWASFKHHSLPEYCCWPCPSLYDYSVPSSDVLPAG